ncbi:MAG: hypothetical protein KIH63_000255 [Candidatus Saccharibacteria bacterium]|nr:hypothetical protein [Candidatus Saccharibacteria bacterium]
MPKVTKSTKSTKIDHATVIDYGTLSDITWPGSVSARNMIASGKINDITISHAIQALNEFYVLVSPAARTRCIDGRHDPELDEKVLGAQVPGGAPGAALAYRLGVDKDDLTRGTFVVDAEEMIARYLRLGFAPGGHRDDHSAGKTAVGCGAIDGMDVILATMMRPDLVDDHKRVVKELLGPLFNRDNYLRNMGAAAVLNGRSADYFRGRETIIDILEKRVKNSIATLKGEHQEAVVVVNFVPGTTLASNRFSETFGLQAFGYDLWRSMQMAEKIMPRSDQAEDRERFIMARVMSTVATLMALTDGSQRLVLRMPV